MNISEKLKNCPKGIKLYSPAFGEVEFSYISKSDLIHVKTDNFSVIFYSNGALSETGECMLFPSRENRDWSTFTLNKFNIATLKPFDRVLVRDNDKNEWYCELYSHYRSESHYKYGCTSSAFYQCIPYNDDTKHLVGTKKDCPEYYKNW